MAKRSRVRPGYVDYDACLEGVDDVRLERELCQRSLYDFVQAAWHLIEPARPFIPGWHVEAVCEHLEAVLHGQITRLVINIPPGSMKSLACSVFFPAWAWAVRPEKKFIFASYADSVTKRDSLRCRNIIDSAWYRARWGHIFKPSEDNWNIQKFSNNQGGFRMATTVAGQVTGEHADVQVVDDAIKPLEVSGTMAVASTALEKALLWWNETMASRLVDFNKSARVIMMQRLHSNDLAGEALRAGGYEHLMLPMVFEEKRRCSTSIGFTDPRTEDGELLWPARFTPEAVAKIKQELGPRGYQAQLQQNPTPAEGTIFKRDWLRFYRPGDMPEHWTAQVQSWDCTFKEAGSSYVAGQVWGTAGANYYLLDQVRDRMGFDATCRALVAQTKKWPRAIGKLVEAKANGDAIVDHLKSRVSGLRLVEPEGGKEARAQAVEPLWAAGNVYLPDPTWQPWVQDFIEELLAFPAGVNDDQVDAMTQALVHLHVSKARKLREAMANI